MRSITFAYHYNKHLATWDNGEINNHILEESRMDDLDQRLTALITEVCQQPPNSRKWRVAMSRLLGEIQQLPKLKKDPHPDYPAALSLTLEWVSKNISQFQPYSESVAESLQKLREN